MTFIKFIKPVHTECEIVDPADFSKASERRVYRVGVKMENDHNGDKNGDYKVSLKIYDEVKVDVLQIYEVTGIYYPG